MNTKMKKNWPLLITEKDGTHVTDEIEALAQHYFIRLVRTWASPIFPAFLLIDIFENFSSISFIFNRFIFIIFVVVEFPKRLIA